MCTRELICVARLVQCELRFVRVHTGIGGRLMSFKWRHERQLSFLVKCGLVILASIDKQHLIGYHKPAHRRQSLQYSTVMTYVLCYFPSKDYSVLH